MTQMNPYMSIQDDINVPLYDLKLWHKVDFLKQPL